MILWSLRGALPPFCGSDPRKLLQIGLIVFWNQKRLKMDLRGFEMEAITGPKGAKIGLCKPKKLFFCQQKKL